jgi:signal transduction histidine kinase
MSQTALSAKAPSLTENRANLVAARRGAVLDEQKRSFLRMVSHELRTPLNSIIGFSEIIAKELCGPLGNPQYKEYAEHVRLSGLKLLRLVNQVLEIARLEGHVTDLDIQPEPLDHAVDDAVDSLREELNARGVRVVVENEGALPAVMADPRGLRTILINLLQNAIAFSPEGGEVRIRAQRRLGRVDLEIEDQGEGIDPQEAARLVRPFEQGESALTRTTEGAGLGLPIVNLLCRAMGGVLRLICEPGKGLRAVVALPPGADWNGD